jgi:citrate lyase subunit beta/citryl-CoA lyase
MRSKLFVPASRPALFPKAMASAADAISFDLEDAVEESSKSAAREALAQYLEQLQPELQAKIIVVRTNAADTSHFAADIEAAAWSSLHLLNLPKVEDADSVHAAAEMLAKLEHARAIPHTIGILANIESPKGLRHAAQIALAHPRVAGLQIGFGDLLAPLGIAQGEPSAVQAIRVQVRLAAGEAGVAAYDGAYVDIADPDGYRRDAQAAQRLGFAGKSCIHPSQVQLANEVFRPSQAEVEHAVRVMDAANRARLAGTGAFVVDGRLVDGPFIARAERLVSVARGLGML